MKLTGAIQEALVALLCYDDSPRGACFVKTLIPIDTFDVYYCDLAEAAIQYHAKYKKVPGEHTLDLVNTLKARFPDKAEIFDQIFHSLEQIKNEINREYVISEATTFARFQRLRQGIVIALEQLQQENATSVEAAEKALLDSIHQSTELFVPGLQFLDPAESLAFLDKEHLAFPTGIPEIDIRGLGPARKRLQVFVASPGAGKSWWLIHLTKFALLHRLRVVYITLELSEDEVAQRCMQALFSVGKRDRTYTRQIFERDELGRFTSFSPDTLDNRPYLRNSNIRAFLTGRLKEFSRRPPLIIREFPTGSLTIQDLENYLDGLEAALNFIPDLILIDYADLMKLTTKYYRLDLGQLYKDLRGIGVKRNIAIATASQANKEGERAQVMTKRHAAEDYSKAGTTDVMITFNQTQDEYELGLARLFMAKGRTDEDKFTVLISQAYGLGQFCLDSVKMVSSYWDSLREVTGEKDEDNNSRTKR